jgi:hypothetical protein
VGVAIGLGWLYLRGKIPKGIVGLGRRSGVVSNQKTAIDIGG